MIIFLIFDPIQTRMAELNYTSEIIAVPPVWENVFSYFYYAVNNGEQPVHKTLLPTFQTILVFSFGIPVSFRLKTAGAGDESMSIEKTMVIGPIKQPVEYTLLPGSEILVANFKWDAFYRFFGRSLKTYKEFASDPDKLVDAHCFSAIWQQLKEIKSLPQKLLHVLDFSARYLNEQDPAASRLMDKSGVGDGNIAVVRQIAGESKQTERTVQLHYQKYYGYSAKEKARYERFQKVISFLASTDPSLPVDWFDVIHHAGYYDQSHLIHDFNHFLHLSPGQYLKFQKDICIAAG